MRALLARYAASSMLKQLALQDAISGEPWHVDLDKGSIWFGDGEPHPVQLLGTEGYGERTWLWAWDNTASELPPEVTQASVRLRAIGEERDLRELVTPRSPLDEIDGNRASAIACGLLDGASTYRGPYEGGAAFFLLTDFPRRDQVNTLPPRLVHAVSMVISTWVLDHRAVLEGLAADLQLPLRERPGALILGADGGDEIEIRLDAEGRIAKMSATAHPPGG